MDEGHVTGRSRNHNGTDFAYYRGAPIRATAAGKVVFAGRRGGFGNLVEIDHGFGIRTRYAHMHKVMVAKGDTVTFRQQIGQLGNTGRSTGPHVHYEIMVRGRPVDPMRFVTAGKYAFKPVPADAVVAVRNEDEKRDGKAAKSKLASAKVDIKPKPRAAASLADRPDSSAWPGTSAWPGLSVAAAKAPKSPTASKPAPEADRPDLSESVTYLTGILPTLRPRKRSYRKRSRARRYTSRRRRRH